MESASWSTIRLSAPCNSFRAGKLPADECKGYAVC
jgi:hypothetical protein